jgi:biotin operon repressor
MLKLKQQEFVLKTLLKNKKVSRNQCLRLYISRLSSIIKRLRDNGYKIETKFDNRGGDCVYHLIKKP